MDPFTIALAVFGVQKLRGKSTGRSFRDALLAAGGAQALSAVSPGTLGIKGFEFGGPFGALSAGKDASLAKGLELGTGVSGPTLPPTFANQLKETFAGKGIKALYGTPEIEGVKGTPEQLYRPEVVVDGKVVQPERAYRAAVADIPAVPARGFQALTPGQKFLTAGVGIPVAADFLFGEEEPPVELPKGFRPEDYLAEKEPARKQLVGLSRRADFMPQYTATYPYNLFNKGGIVNALPKFSAGGINYLPSKITHDENDINNYNRINGYVEDGTGNGDKNEDTILAQLADGEFVSRTDAILGAGILEGASPTNQKDMRKKGAAFFYDQQAKFKRIFDLLNASRKTIN